MLIWTDNIDSLNKSQLDHKHYIPCGIITVMSFNSLICYHNIQGLYSVFSVFSVFCLLQVAFLKRGFQRKRDINNYLCGLDYYSYILHHQKKITAVFKNYIDHSYPSNGSKSPSTSISSSSQSAILENSAKLSVRDGFE